MLGLPDMSGNWDPMRLALIENRMCSVINTKCKPNSIFHSLQEILDIIDLWCYKYVASIFFQPNFNHP